MNGSESFRINAKETALGSLEWLRMLAQAGVTMLPATGRQPHASESTSEPALDWAWEQVIEAGVTPVEDHAHATAIDSTRGGAPAIASDPTAAGRGATLEPPHEPRNSPTAPITSKPTNARGKDASNSCDEVISERTPEPKPAASRAHKSDLSTFQDFQDSERIVRLQQIAARVKDCTLCSELVKFRIQPVFGTGNVRPRLVMMGEAPGADEDRLGEPFVGASGQLLDKIIAAMKLKREDVYILNSVKCRPPQNRTPTDSECRNCRPFWEGQLELLQPEVVVCLGSVASKTLLQTVKPVGQLRGTIHEYRGAKVVVTYHPSYLLRTESAKRQTWDDMKVVMNLLGMTQ